MEVQLVAVVQRSMRRDDPYTAGYVELPMDTTKDWGWLITVGAPVVVGMLLGAA